MKLEFKILNTSEYREIYYLYLFRRLKECFYQKRGFLITPKAQLKNSGEVIIPEIDFYDSLKPNFDKFISANEKSYEFPFRLTRKEYLRIRPFKLSPFSSDYNVKRLQVFITKNKKKISDAIEYINPDIKNKNILIEIIPVDFGTPGTFSEFFRDGNWVFRVTCRVDMGVSAFVKGIIANVVCSKLNEKAGAQEDNLFWQKRQFLIDFLVGKTKISKIIERNLDLQTLESIEGLRQMGDFIKASKEYLKKLGFDYGAEIEVTENTLKFDGSKVYLTDSEKKVFRALLQKKGEICSFDELGEVLWADNEEKFSPQAISRVLSDIRAKVKSTGYATDMIYTARGKGVLLNV